MVGLSNSGKKEVTHVNIFLFGIRPQQAIKLYTTTKGQTPAKAIQSRSRSNLKDHDSS